MNQPVPSPTVFLDGQALHLPHDAFVAAGGEATVFAIDDVAYKRFHQPIDPARLVALSALGVAGALLPQRLIHDDQGRCIGHTMAYLRDGTPLSRALSRTWRDREGLDPDGAMSVVRQLRARVAAVHRAGALVVDLHEGNVLLDADRCPVLIDTSSWQLPGFPATAIQDTVRDRHATLIDQGTDWFAFAVLTLHLLLGIHPYRGTHPTVKGLDARMQRRLSVLRPEVRVPASCFPVAVVPMRWRRWYAAVLDGSDRSPPPDGPHDAIAWTPAILTSGRRLHAVTVLEAPSPILSAADAAGTTAVHTAHAVFVGPRHHPGRVDALTVTAEGHPVTARRVGSSLHLTDLHTQRILPTTLHADAIAPLGHGFVVRSGPRLIQLDLRAGLALPRLLAAVLPHATHLFPGLAVQDLLGAAHLLLLSPNRCAVRRVPELDGWTVLDARHQAGVAVVLARRQGRTDRLVFRFAPDRYELRRTEDVDTAAIDLVVLPSRVAVLQVDGRLEIFRPRPSDPDLRLIEDPLLHGARLCPLGEQLGLIAGNRLLRLTMA